MTEPVTSGGGRRWGLRVARSRHSTNRRRAARDQSVIASAEHAPADRDGGVGVVGEDAVDAEPVEERELGRDEWLFEREADRIEVGRVLGLGVDPDALALREVDDLLQRRDLEAPSNAVLAGRSWGRRSLARSVLSSASVKSSVNQPVNGCPSIIFVLRRFANSGCCATSVVPPISGSWRATSTPSLVIARSGSM